MGKLLYNQLFILAIPKAGLKFHTKFFLIILAIVIQVILVNYWCVKF
jgi:hypothetical protein